MNAIEFVKEKFSHLKQFYKTEEEMIEHFLQEGENEVMMPVHDVIHWLDEIFQGKETETTTTSTTE